MRKMFGRKRRVAILGAGPAGLFAAWGARQAGHEVHIISQRVEPSHINGAQYLHGPIPALTMDPARIYYHLEGTALGYAEKVYGPERGPSMAAKVSPVTLSGIQHAWEIRGSYERAWKAFEQDMAQDTVNAANLEALVKGDWYHRIISSIPPQAYCLGDHAFHSADIYSKGDAPELNSWCPVMIAADTVVCNGEKSPGWYRAANVFGYRTAEWPGYRPPPIEGIARVTKPLSTNCDCFEYHVTRVGRYGTWTKGVLSHSAYYATKEALA